MKVAPTCIKCFSDSAAVNMSLRLDGDGEPLFTCEACEEEFTCEDVRKFLAAQQGWAKMLTWVDAMPTDE